MDSPPRKVAVAERSPLVEVRLYFKFLIEIIFSYFVSSGVRTALRLNNIPVLRVYHLQRLDQNQLIIRRASFFAVLTRLSWVSVK